MENHEKSPFDDFRTVGDERSGRGRKQSRLAGLFWMVVAGLLLGALVGGGAYIAFEFWRGAPPQHQYGRQYRMYVEITKNPLSEEELGRRIKLSALLGAGLFATAAAGLAIKGAPGKR